MLRLDFNLVWNIVNVIVLYLLLKHFLIKPVMDIMNKRQDVYKRQVWAHCEGFGGALDCAKAGVHLIIHGQALNDECLDIMAEKGIYFCPTIQFLHEWFKTYPPTYVPEIHDQFEGSDRCV